jgi:adenylate kinase
LSLNLILFGAPGAGKGTYAVRLSSLFGIVSIATGDMFREEIKRDTPLGRKVAEYVRCGKLVPDDIVIDILAGRLRGREAEKGFILDGFPRTVEQAEALGKIAKIDAIVQIVVPEWIIVERLSNRRVCSKCGTIYNLRYLKPKKEGVCDKCGGTLYQREDDRPDVVKERLKVYERQTQPLIEYYRPKTRIIKIENNEIDTPPGAIIDKIVEQLKKTKIMKT